MQIRFDIGKAKFVGHGPESDREECKAMPRDLSATGQCQLSVKNIFVVSSAMSTLLCKPPGLLAGCKWQLSFYRWRMRYILGKLRIEATTHVSFFKWPVLENCQLARARELRSLILNRCFSCGIMQRVNAFNTCWCKSSCTLWQSCQYVIWGICSCVDCLGELVARMLLFWVFLLSRSS